MKTEFYTVRDNKKGFKIEGKNIDFLGELKEITFNFSRIVQNIKWEYKEPFAYQFIAVYVFWYNLRHLQSKQSFL